MLLSFVGFYARALPYCDSCCSVQLSCLSRAEMHIADENARVDASRATALDQYVAQPDGNYSYYVTNTTYSGLFGSWKGTLLNMTSQFWLPAEEVGAGSVWTHQLVVIVPKQITDPSLGILWITGGDVGDGAPSSSSEDMVLTSTMATAAGQISAALFQIPNQPIVMPGDPTKEQRKEDAVLAWGWMKYVTAHNAGQTPDPRWLPRLPMTKAAVRAMDTVAAWAATSGDVADALEAGGHARNYYAMSGGDGTAGNLSRFIVAGASKRGWTTWTTAAVDKRVVAMAPVVLDALHVDKFLHTQWQSYGGFTFALADYTALNITQMVDTPGFAALQSVVDPASYLDRYAGIPKLVVDATGDEFLMPMDDADWWDELPEPKKRLMVQNTDHSLATGIVEVLDSVPQWMSAFARGQSEPEFQWEVSADGTRITLNTTTKPSKVQVWTAVTGNLEYGTQRRDFRMVTATSPCPYKVVSGDLCLIPIQWNATTLKPTTPGGGGYIAHFDPPAPGSGWRGFLIEVQFPSHDVLRPFIYSTQCSLIPRTLPFPPCSGSSCVGPLV